MVKINEALYELQRENLFSNVAKKVNEYQSKNPNKKIISLGVGDVSKPIAMPVIRAMHQAVDDLGGSKTFRGYGPTSGYDFLKDKILENDYKEFGFERDEIYISCGTKMDSTSILELFDKNARICTQNPMYPIYQDGATCLNRTMCETPLSEETDFVLDVPKEKYDLLYLCSPNNPIGNAFTYEELKRFVDYAVENECIILYDNVYEAFIVSENVPHSIYEIPNSKKVAIEFRSYSKNASFTGVRCSYYVIPNEIYPNVNSLWQERTINRFNGADYIAQKGAEAIYLEESQKQIKKNIQDYSNNTLYLKNTFLDLGFKTWGGIDCPFVWIKTKDNKDCWDFFQFMLEELNIVIIPGSIFGSYGDKYFRISGLGLKEEIEEAVRRLKAYYEKKV